MIIKNSEKPVEKTRFYVQLFFLTITLWIGIEFFFFIQWLESGGVAAFVSRPPGVEAFLPISSLMSVYLFFLTGNLHPVHPAGVFIFLAILAVSFIFGKAFCSWICPVGFISEMVGDFGEKVQKKLFGRTLRLPRVVDYPLRSLKYLLLLFFGYAIFTMSAAAVKSFLDTPYNIMSDVKMYYFFANISQTALVVVSVLTILSVVIRNFWCRFLCPYGALLGIFAILSPTKIKRNVDSCTDCTKCAKVCPSRIKVDKVKTVVSDECVSCLSCLDACPVANTLELKPMGSQKRINKKYIGFAIVIIYFVIIGIGIIGGHWDNNIDKQTYLELYPDMNSMDHLQGLKEAEKADQKNLVRNK